MKDDLRLANLLLENKISIDDLPKDVVERLLAYGDLPIRYCTRCCKYDFNNGKCEGYCEICAMNGFNNGKCAGHWNDELHSWQ